MQLMHRAIAVLEHVERCWSDSNDQARKRAHIAAKALAVAGVRFDGGGKLDCGQLVQDESAPAANVALLTIKELEAITTLLDIAKTAMRDGKVAIPPHAHEVIGRANAFLDRARERLTAENAAKSDLPPFVIPGKWIDPSPDPVTGPRYHPYGAMNAFYIIHNNICMTFPDKAAADGWRANNESPPK